MEQEVRHGEKRSLRGVTGNHRMQFDRFEMNNLQ
jgi:hypothetical protein